MSNKIIPESKVLCQTCKRRIECMCSTYCPAVIMNEPCDSCNDPTCKQCNYYEEGIVE